jgi:hypothetical protein
MIFRFLLYFFGFSERRLFSLLYWNSV